MYFMIFYKVYFHCSDKTRNSVGWCEEDDGHIDWLAFYDLYDLV